MSARPSGHPPAPAASARSRRRRPGGRCAPARGAPGRPSRANARALHPVRPRAQDRPAPPPRGGGRGAPKGRRRRDPSPLPLRGPSGPRRGSGERPGPQGPGGRGVPPMRGVLRMDHRWLPPRCTGRADAQGLGGPRRARPRSAVTPGRGSRGGRCEAPPRRRGRGGLLRPPRCWGALGRAVGRPGRPVGGRPPDAGAPFPLPWPAIPKTGASWGGRGRGAALRVGSPSGGPAPGPRVGCTRPDPRPRE